MKIYQILSFSALFSPLFSLQSDAGFFDLCCSKDATATRGAPSSGANCCTGANIRKAVSGAAILTTAAHNGIVGGVVNAIPVVGPAAHAVGGIVSAGLTVANHIITGRENEGDSTPLMLGDTLSASATSPSPLSTLAEAALSATSALISGESLENLATSAVHGTDSQSLRATPNSLILGAITALNIGGRLAPQNKVMANTINTLAVTGSLSLGGYAYSSLSNWLVTPASSTNSSSTGALSLESLGSAYTIISKFLSDASAPQTGATSNNVM